jgi:peptide chain release factor subunit 1
LSQAGLKAGLYKRTAAANPKGMRLAIRHCMEKSTTALETPLREQLDRLAGFTPSEMPVLSLYLNMAPNEQGKDHYAPFLRKTFPERILTLQGAARKSFERDVERINDYLAKQVRPSVNGLAIYACAAANDFFQAVQLDVPLDHHWLYIGAVPHLYPLARLNDQNPRYAALLADTNSARLFVFGLRTTEAREEVTNIKTRKTMTGGWSQARYQRHIENFHVQHMKEVVEVLDRVVRDEKINQIVVACDAVARPMLMEQLPKHLAEKVLDMAKLDAKAPEHKVLAETMEALREKDAETDAERVQAMFDAWRGGGLGVVGPESTMAALVMGQVEELLITATPERLRRARISPDLVTPGPVEIDTSHPNNQVDTDRHKLADELVTKAQQTSARIRFIEHPKLLEEVGGVGAILRFKI